MTETEWEMSNDPRRMLQVIEASLPSERKVRLFNAAICRRYWEYLPEESKAILSESELLADGLVQRGSGEFDLCHRANAIVGPLDRKYPTKRYPNAKTRIRRDSAAAVCYAVIPNELWGAVSYFWEINPAEKEWHSAILRDVFGNPFRQVSLDPSSVMCGGAKLMSIAQAIYDNRGFDRLPLLADALEGAGCTNAYLLAHCRQLGPHFKGCWAVDLILGKT
jgi:hypothetical protein